MPVVVGSNLIEPAPFVNISKQLTLGGNQSKLSQTYRLTIEGDLVAYLGSPQGGSLSNANFGGPFGLFWQGSAPAPGETGVSPNITHHLYNIERKQRAMESLFSTNGQWIEWQSPDGSQPLKAQFKNANITWQAGSWAQTAHYQIEAECDLLYLLGDTINDINASGYIQNASETWNIDIGEAVKTFNVRHDLSAQGKIAFDSLGNVTQPAWQNARDFVLTQLTLGWSGTSPYSTVAGGTIFSQSALASGVLSLSNYGPYNYSLTESVDEVGGSYSVSETYVLAPASSGSHVYTVSTRRIVDDPYTTVVSNVQGTIRGYYNGLFNYDQRIAAANYVWASLAAPTGLLNLIVPTDSYNVSSTGYNLQPRQGSIDYNVNEGTLSYNYEFSNTLYHNDAFEQWTLSRKTSSDSYLTTFGINGTVKGRRYDGDTDTKASFTHAYTYWASLSGSNYDALYQRVLSNTYFPEATGMALQPSPVNKSIDLNEAEGVITYSLEFNNRKNISDVNDDSVQETFQIAKHFDVNDGITSYTINGEVVGLNVTDVNPQQSKWNAASGYFTNTVLPNLYSRISTYYGINLPNTTAQSVEITEQPVLGVITYSYTYNNLFPPLLSGALSEHITVNENNYNQQVRVTAKIPVPGRSSGPVIQDVATSVIKSRTINIETVMGPTGDLSNLGNTLALKPSYDGYVNQLQPANSYCENWSDTWDFRYGRYTLTAEFIYE